MTITSNQNMSSISRIAKFAFCATVCTMKHHHSEMQLKNKIEEHKKKMEDLKSKTKTNVQKGKKIVRNKIVKIAISNSRLLLSMVWKMIMCKLFHTNCKNVQCRMIHASFKYSKSISMTIASKLFKLYLE